MVPIFFGEAICKVFIVSISFYYSARSAEYSITIYH